MNDPQTAVAKAQNAVSSDTPIEVNGSLIQAQLVSAAYTAGILLAAGTAIAGFVKAHDLAGFINYVKSDTFKPVAAVLATIGLFVWRQYKVRQSKAEKVVLADAAPDGVGKVV